MMVAGKILGECCRFNSCELRIGVKKEANMTCMGSGGAGGF
jgi:hypothetical protein